jgi:hypothetical protein
VTTKQQRKILEFAAKACGVELEPFIAGKKPCRLIEDESGEGYISVLWNPLTSPADCAEMCAELKINWLNLKDSTGCRQRNYNSSRRRRVISAWENIKDHDDSRLKAWMFAATMCAAKTQGYEE